jgi:hypothetical protein
MAGYEQEIEEVKVTFQCECDEKLVYYTWDENLSDNPYVDVECKCGIYYKKRGSIRKNGGKELNISYTGKLF